MLKNGFEILLSVKLGAIILTLTWGAHSAAKDLPRPSNALFADPITEWFGNPL